MGIRAPSRAYGEDGGWAMPGGMAEPNAEMCFQPGPRRGSRVGHAEKAGRTQGQEAEQGRLE